MPTLLESIVFSYEFRGFSTGGADTTTVLKANAGEKVRANLQFRVQIESKANVGNGDEFLVQTISGVTSITANTADFVADGWRVGDVFTFTDNSGGGIGAAPGQIITLVSGNFMEITLLAPLVPNTYVNVDMQLTTELDTLRYQYNFTQISDRSDLIQQMLKSIQGFEYKGLTDLAFHAGVAFVPDLGNTGSSQAKRRAVSANFVQFFEVEHDFIIIPSGKEDQLNNLQTNNIPDPYRTETILYNQIIDIGVGNDNSRLRTLPIKRNTTDFVGWRNENFDGGVNDYVVDSVSYLNVATNGPLDVIEAKAVTRVTAVISRVSGTFTIGDSTIVHHSYLPVESAYQSTVEDYQTAWIYESLKNDIDAGATSGTVITNYEATLAANILTVVFDIQYTVAQLALIFDDGAYDLYISLADNTSLNAEESNRVALNIDADRLTKNPDIAGLVSNEVMHFYNHPLDFVDGVSTGFTSLQTWIEEGIMLSGFFFIEGSGRANVVESLSIELIAEDTVTGEIFVIKSDTVPTITQTFIQEGSDTVQVLELESERGFLLPPNDQFNNLNIENGIFAAGAQEYKYQIGLKITWQDWEKLQSAPGKFFDTSKLNNGLNKKSDNYDDSILTSQIKYRQVLRVNKGGIITTYNALTPVFRVFDYEKDINVTPDFTGEVTIKDKNGNPISDNLIQNENSEVTVTFDDGETKISPTNFEAVVRIQVKQQGTEDSIHEISSLRGVLSGDILKPLSGEIQLQKSIVSGNYTVKCLTDGLQLSTADQSISCRLYNGIKESLLFDGTNERVDHGSFSGLTFARTEAFSYEYWIHLNATGILQIVASNQVPLPSPSGFFTAVTSGDKIIFYLQGDEAPVARIQVETTSATLSVSTWTHVAVTKSTATAASSVKIYIDGISVSLTTTFDSLGVDPAVDDLTVGARERTVFQNFLDANLKGLAFWDKELSAAEVTESYNSGCPLNLNSHSASSNLVSWFPIDGDTIAEIRDQASGGTNDGTPVNMDSTNITKEAPSPC